MAIPFRSSYTELLTWVLTVQWNLKQQLTELLITQTSN